MKLDEKKPPWNKTKEMSMLEKEILMFFEAGSFLSQNQVHLHLKAGFVSFTKCTWLNIFTEIT